MKHALVTLAHAFLLIGLLLLAVSCSVDKGANEHRKCSSNDDCDKAGTVCYKGFCVADDAAGSSGSGGKGGSKDDGGVAMGDAGVDEDGGEADAGEDASVAVPDDKIGNECSLEAGKSEPCYLGKDPDSSVKGVCRAGRRVCDCPGGAKQCDQKVWGECFDQILPSPELCDGKDNDCNGEVDDDVVVDQSCVVPGAKGVCAEGHDSCVNGTPVCNQTVEPTAELCDGLNNDCDDEIDEDTDRICYPADTEGCTQDSSTGSFSCKGICQPGIQLCDKKKHEYGDCGGAGLVTPDAENCDRVPGVAARNEDCDDSTDEGCDCDDGMSYPCYDGTTGANGTEGVGPCHAGAQLCTNHVLGACENQVMPQEETCANDGVDDDCDNMQDDVPGRDTECHNFSKKGLCKDGTLTCESGALKCVTPEPVDEICDGKDNDCDGEIDNGFDFKSDPKHCGDCDTICGQGEVCCDGHCADTKSDARYCGRCDNRCGAGGICCDGLCKNSNSDAMNCKTCGKDCTLLGLLGACCSGTCQSLGCGG